MNPDHPAAHNQPDAEPEPTDLGVEDFELEMPDDMEVRHCYRHPDRETGVSCSNCGKPICYECMIPAPVGFRCPDCVSGPQRSTARPQVITRQQTRQRWQRSAGIGLSAGNTVTRVLVALNVVAFVIELVLGGSITGISGRALYDLGALYPPAIALEHQYWRLFTSMFLHYSIFHILFNMWALYVVGTWLEHLVGRSKYIAIYLLAGLTGSALSFALAPVNSLTVGASGAIFGLFGAVFVYAYNNRHTMASAIMRSMGLVIGINLIITFLPGSGISWQGHIGGLVGGIVTMELFCWFGRRDARGPWRSTDIATVVAVAAVIIALVVWRVATFPLSV